jgi:trimeric autotransporter adhesin
VSGRALGLVSVLIGLTALAAAPGAQAEGARLAAGLGHTCAVTADGAVKCWGLNEQGQIGDGGTANASGPTQVSGLDSGIVGVAAGGNHSCALSEDGGVRCWGWNINGQLGDGSRETRLTPVAVSGLSTGVAAIVAGYAHTCALTTAGAVKCWGDNLKGQLGDGSTDDRDTPVAVSGLSSGVVAITAGAFHTCAVTEGGAVKCWGDDERGQLGNGTTGEFHTPVDVVGLSSGVKAVAAGIEHTCALTETGGVRCWGLDSSGQLGDGGTANSDTPVAVSGLTGASAITTGGYHSCAVSAAGGVECWGANDEGQLGDGGTADSSVPVAVSSILAGTVAIAGGERHSCALSQAGGVKCWGWNAYGQVGNGGPMTTVPLSAIREPQSIAFPAIANRSLGEADFEPGATASSGLPVTYESETFATCRIVSGKVHMIGGGECRVKALQEGDEEFDEAEPVTVAFTVEPAAQTITFPQIADRTVGEADFEPGASSSSGLLVAYVSATVSTCTIVEEKVHLVAGGECRVIAGQPGNASYLPASPVEVSFEVLPAAQTITFPALADRTFGEPDFEPGATASSGLPVTYSATETVCAVVAGKVRLLAAGECSLFAEQAGDASYEAAATVERSFTVARAAQTIDFPALATRTVGEADFAPGATSSSGLAVTYASQSEPVCTIVAGSVHLVAQGECQLIAEQAGDHDHLPAAPMTRSFAVAAAAIPPIPPSQPSGGGAPGDGAPGGWSLTSGQLAGAARRGLAADVTPKGGRLVLDASCPAAIGSSCKVSLRALRRKGQPLGAARGATIAPGGTRLLALPVKPKLKGALGDLGSVLIEERISAAGATATVLKRLPLAHPRGHR